MSLNILPNEDQQIDKIIKSIANIVQDLLTQKDQVVIAVSGGKSPIALFKKLSNTDLKWQNICITLVDERITDTSSKDSNENLVHEHLLQNKAKLAQFYGLVTSELDIKNMITNANNLVNQIDIAILGMGEDGHTASIFPECSEFDTATDEFAAPSYVETNPLSAKYKRIGLNLAAITQIKHLILSINGSLKLKIVQESIRNKTRSYPISYLLDKRSDTQIFYFE